MIYKQVTIQVYYILSYLENDCDISVCSRGTCLSWRVLKSVFNPGTLGLAHEGGVLQHLSQIAHTLTLQLFTIEDKVKALQTRTRESIPLENNMEIVS